MSIEDIEIPAAAWARHDELVQRLKDRPDPEAWRPAELLETDGVSGRMGYVNGSGWRTGTGRFGTAQLWMRGDHPAIVRLLDDAVTWVRVTPADFIGGRVLNGAPLKQTDGDFPLGAELHTVFSGKLRAATLFTGDDDADAEVDIHYVIGPDDVAMGEVEEGDWYTHEGCLLMDPRLSPDKVDAAASELYAGVKAISGLTRDPRWWATLNELDKKPWRDLARKLMKETLGA